MRMFPKVLCGVLTLAGLVRADSAGSSHQDYVSAAAHFSEAMDAYKAGNHSTFLHHMAVACRLRSDHPTYHYYLAAAHALNHHPDKTATALNHVAAWGLYLPADEQDDFQELRDTEFVRSAFDALKANLQPTGTGELAFELPANGGLWEGIAHRDATGETYFSDLHHAVIVSRDENGSIRRFARMPSPGFGCGGLAIDESHGLLWASSPAMPEVAGFEDALAGRSELVAFSLTDGSVSHVVSIPFEAEKQNTLVDLTVAPDGTVYAADSTSPVVWAVAPRSREATRFVTIDSPGERHSLQGTAVTPDGRWLFVADYSTGIHAVSTTNRQSSLLTLPNGPGTTLLGIDGLALRGNTLIGLQNGVRPARVLSFSIKYNSRRDVAPTLADWSIAAAAHSTLTDPTLATAGADAFLVIGNAGWSHFGPNAAPDSDVRSVPIVRIPFDS